MHLSLLAQYRIRQLFQRHRHNLKQVLAPGRAFITNTPSDPTVLLDALYLEEADRTQVEQALECSTRLHQLLQAEGENPETLWTLESHILAILGFQVQAPG